MKIHIIQHVAHEGPGVIAAWAKSEGHTTSVTKVFNNERYPEASDLDMLVIMGGPMGVYEQDLYPWIAEEKTFIRQCIDRKKIVLGICLGAQFIASALGARVYPGKEPEIGWFPLTLTDEALSHSISNNIPSPITVFHWHNDTFDLPEGSQRIAFSKLTPNQAFMLDDRILALQFHFEIDREAFTTILPHLDETGNGRYLQSRDEIRDNMHHIEANNLIMIEILNKMSRVYGEN